MSLIKITQEAINRSKPPESGWHKFKITDYNERPTKDKKSTNYVWELTGIDGTNSGRVTYYQVNSQVADGLLVQSGFLAAALDKPITAELEFDPENLKSKEMWAEITESTYNGNIQKRPTAFSPGSSRPPF